MRRFDSLLSGLFVMAVTCCGQISLPTGWSQEGDTFVANITTTPIGTLEFTLHLGSYSSVVEAVRRFTIRNSTASPIAFGPITQTSGRIHICACTDGGNLNLGSLAPGDCIRLKAIPEISGGSVLPARIVLEGLLDLDLSVSIANPGSDSSGGLVIGSGC